jgi:NAD-reducing hydrogenase large subunit
MGTPRADARLARFKVAHRFGRIEVQHEARLIEMVAALEQIEALLDDPALGGPVASPPRRLMATRGVGVAEAPRGLLFHDYTIDADGVLQAVNLLIATSQNAAALKAALTTLARTFSPAQLREEHTLWALECVVRGFDPCLSCATHLAADAAADPRLVVNPAPAPQPEGRGHR